MNLQIRLLALCGVLLISGYTGAASAPESSISKTDGHDSDAIELAELSQQAVQLAQTEAPAVALRQITTDLHRYTFLFTDVEATKIIHIHIPGANVPSDQWTVQVDT